jgi:hypothetical protein
MAFAQKKFTGYRMLSMHRIFLLQTPHGKHFLAHTQHA